MSDLISRSALLKYFEEEKEKIKVDSEKYHIHEEAVAGMEAALQAITNKVNEMPTAYDIEKVVAELEEEKEISCADFTKYVNEYNPCLDDEYDDFFHKGLERAIEVIRKGGAE